jgi:hypothetical protein
MSLYKIKRVAGRSTWFGLAVALFGASLASALPATVFADAYNPLTERSLMLSSSSPGWSFSDGSGNTEGNLNAAGETYAEPGSGANGKKTEETFSFKVSTDSSTSPHIRAMTFQYCTAAAGTCTPPGNGSDATHSNLNLVYTSPAETTDFEVRKGASTWGASTQVTGWTMKTYRVADAAGSTTTEKNFVTLTNDDSDPMDPASNEMVWVRFNASSTKYITNPGAGAFFVRINTFDTDDTVTTDTTPANSVPDVIDPYSVANGQTHIIDGGVTVANVMNQSIWITTKVLETMSFSVGKTDPDLTVRTHGVCDPIEDNTELKIGDSSQEYSLQYGTAFDALSYWRLATNSSAGATVYYAGNTLRNTVGDKISAIGTSATKSHPGTEQFGLGIDSRLDSVTEDGAAPDNTLLPLVAATPYADAGSSDNISDSPDSTNAGFAFDEASDFEPVAIASNSSGVLNCSTARMRYIGNIAPSTPAGVYTTKINYIAAPKY